jgi:hypothetical protein
MSADCKNINPLRRSGVSQIGRMQQALETSFINVDERDDANLVLFAKKFAAYLNYYNIDNLPDGNWQALMGNDIAVLLAEMATQPVKNYNPFAKQLFTEILQASDAASAASKFKVLFDLVFSLTIKLDQQLAALPDTADTKSFALHIIQSKLQNSFTRFLAYYKAAIDAGADVLDPSSTYHHTDEPFVLQLSQEAVLQRISGIWTGDEKAFVIQDFINTIDANTLSEAKKFFNLQKSSLLKIQSAATYNLFTSIFDAYANAFIKIAEEANENFNTVLENFSGHAPHKALFYSFIKLFREAQDQLNGFTKKHLDLFYKEILKLKNREAVADNVNVIFELAKNLDDHLVAKGTLLKAGKDNNSKDQFYALQNDIVINGAKIAAVKSVFSDPENNGKLYASPVANSADGIGGKFLNGNNKWQTFGAANTSPLASAGFALASAHLFLNEGMRNITLTLNVNSKSANNLNAVNVDINNIATQLKFDISFTGAKGWITQPAIRPVVQDQQIIFNITIDGGQAAVIPFSKKIHDGNFVTALPLMKAVLQNNTGEINQGNILSSIIIDSVDINVNVSGIKNIAGNNESGNIDPSKPFQPFGSKPRGGSAFVFGSKEIFQKNISSCTLNYEFDKLSAADFTTLNNRGITVSIYKLQLQDWGNNIAQNFLFNGNSVSPVAADLNRQNVSVMYSNRLLQTDSLMLNTAVNYQQLVKTFPSQAAVNASAAIPQNNNSIISIDLAALQTITIPDFTANENFSLASKDGFIKIELDTDLYADDYATAFTQAAIDRATDKTTPLPAPYYIPAWRFFSIDYSASETIDLTASAQSDLLTSKFFHVYPFGCAEQDQLFSGTAINFLPAFKEGELYIGIDNFTPSRVINILFSVAEGSANPLKQNPAVTWNYLMKNNQWKNFTNAKPVDGTNGLVQSGIIQFTIDGSASDDHTLFDDDYFWIRASVEQDADAVCELISIDAQAAVAVYNQGSNDIAAHNFVLLQNTISKPAVSDAAIKKITQPYNSFSGIAAEQDEHFYLRVSERLRHKKRAVTMWDYERIVLEAFPEVYKVKCINHTQFENAASSNIYNEVAPGYVMVVPIPDLKNNNAADPLKPYTSIGLLDKINDYLKNFISPFANLNVVNPKFEQIRLQFNVKLFDGNDPSFYQKFLDAQITQFLSPWAFGAANDIEFGGRIAKSVIIQFIEQQPYVDYLTDVQLICILDDGTVSGDVDEVIATTARSVLVSNSNPSGFNHVINILPNPEV